MESDSDTYDPSDMELNSDFYFGYEDYAWVHEGLTDSEYETGLAQPRTLFGLCVRVVKKTLSPQVIATKFPRLLVNKILLRMYVRLPSGWYYSRTCNFIAVNLDEINKEETKALIDRMGTRCDWPRLVGLYGHWIRYEHYTPSTNYSIKLAVHVLLNDMNMSQPPVISRPFLYSPCVICDSMCFVTHRCIEIPAEADYSVIGSYLELSENNSDIPAKIL